MPGLLRVGGEGSEGLREAVELEGLEFSMDNADLWVVWKPVTQAGTISNLPDSVRAVTVVSKGVVGNPLAFEAGRRPAKMTITLREWVSRWPMGKLISPLLASDAVGARTCSALSPDCWEELWLAAPPVVKQASPGGLKEMLVTACGCGLFPIMPATLASAVMVPPALLIHHFFGGWIFLFVAIVVTVLATAASCLLEKWAGRRFLAEDPREFVLDEVAGMALTWAMLPPSAPTGFLLVGFFLFRIFDIFKWGVSWIESLPFPGKIVWDDLLAAVYAGAVTLLCWQLWRIFA